MTPKTTLEVISIHAPCLEDWGRMKGDERSRFCGVCHSDVHNLSAMTLEEAAQLVERGTGNLCVRFYRRADGTVLTKDCTPDRIARLKRDPGWDAPPVVGAMPPLPENDG